MLKKTMTYVDFDGNERTEDFHFNLSKTELMEMELNRGGGMSDMLKAIVAAKDVERIGAIFKEILLKAFGEKSPDGKRFIKSKELSEAFSQTVAYDNLFMELATDANAASAFITAVLPKKES